MAVSAELLEILVCPETKSALSVANEDVISRINHQIQDQGVQDRGGNTVDQPIDSGLIRADGQILYPVRDGIPVLLIENGIQLSLLD